MLTFFFITKELYLGEVINISVINRSYVSWFSVNQYLMCASIKGMNWWFPVGHIQLIEWLDLIPGYI